MQTVECAGLQRAIVNAGKTRVFAAREVHTALVEGGNAALADDRSAASTRRQLETAASATATGSVFCATDSTIAAGGGSNPRDTICSVKF